MSSNITTIWSQLQEKLRQFISSRIEDKTAVDDILQDVFIKLQTQIHKLKNTEKTTSWIYQITRNTITDYHRQQQKDRNAQDQLLVSAISDRRDITEEFALCVIPMIESLPDPYRDAVHMTEIEGISQKELAKRLGISYSGAKSRVQRGREKLKEILLACCDIQTDQYGNVIDYQPKCYNCSTDDFLSN
ncbi:MAG: RNA polymerase sigma factor SigZ [Aureispira sp.]|nr:RNA polymerase sigma factor SigZ [Aureispira sp.]